MGNSVLSDLAARAPLMKTVSLPRGRHPLHAMPTSAGYEIQTDARYDWDGRKRGQTPFTVLQHTIAGAGNLRYGRRVHRVIPGETLVVTIPHNHRYWVEEGGRWEFFWISMNGQEALRIHRNVLSAAGPVLRLRGETIELLAACSLRLIDNPLDTAGSASAIAYEALMALYDDVFGSRAGSPAKMNEMRRVADYVRGNLDKPLGVPDLAKLSGFSRAHFSRIFARSEGLPPAEFVLNERMRAAARILASNESVPVKEVAMMAGFADSNYFAKTFRRLYGASPTEFRTTGMYASAQIGNAR
jgi:AraC-like DNA-binding protein